MHNTQTKGGFVVLKPNTKKTAQSGPNHTNAGWSSPVARQAHNLKVVSSNLAPATRKYNQINV